MNVNIDKSGKTRSVTILRGVRGDLDLEAIRVINLIPYWLPEIKDGKPVESTIVIPIKFQLKK